MKKLKTYLIGSIQDAKDPNECREEIEKKLVALGFEVLNPCKFETNVALASDINEQKKKLENLKKGGAWKQYDEIMNAIVLSDEIAVLSSEYVVVFWDTKKKHGGTIHEIIMALEHNIPIYTICYNPISEFNDWILCLLRKNFSVGGQIFPNNKQAIEHIEKIHKSYIEDITKNVNS